MPITCCEIAITLALTNIVSLAIFAGYTVHLRLRQLVLEKKNGKEQHQIDQLKKEVEDLKSQKSND
jgi:cell division protein FtsL